jgi:hypothetical protein
MIAFMVRSLDKGIKKMKISTTTEEKKERKRKRWT